MLSLEILKDYLLDIFSLDIFDVGWTTSQIIKYIAYLEVMQIEVALMQFGVCLL